MQVFRLISMSAMIFYCSRAMLYSSISVLPVLLTILLLILEHTSEGIVSTMSNQLIHKLHSVLVSLVRHWLNTWKIAPGTRPPIILKLCSCPDMQHRVPRSFLVRFNLRSTLLCLVVQAATKTMFIMTHSLSYILLPFGFRMSSIWIWLESLSSNLMNWKRSLLRPSSLPT